MDRGCSCARDFLNAFTRCLITSSPNSPNFLLRVGHPSRSRCIHDDGGVFALEGHELLFSCRRNAGSTGVWQDALEAQSGIAIFNHELGGRDGESGAVDTEGYLIRSNMISTFKLSTKRSNAGKYAVMLRQFIMSTGQMAMEDRL